MYGDEVAINHQSYLMMKIQHHGEDGKELYACEDMTKNQKKYERIKTKNQNNMRELRLMDSLAVWGEWKTRVLSKLLPSNLQTTKRQEDLTTHKLKNNK